MTVFIQRHIYCCRKCFVLEHSEQVCECILDERIFEWVTVGNEHERFNRFTLPIPGQNMGRIFGEEFILTYDDNKPKKKIVR